MTINRFKQKYGKDNGKVSSKYSNSIGIYRMEDSNHMLPNSYKNDENEVKLVKMNKQKLTQSHNTVLKNPQNTAELLYLLSIIYGFQNKMDKKMNQNQYIHFIKWVGKYIDFSDVHKLVAFNREDTINHLRDINHACQAKDYTKLKDAAYITCTCINMTLALCVGTLMSTSSIKLLNALRSGASKLSHIMSNNSKTIDYKHMQLLSQHLLKII